MSKNTNEPMNEFSSMTRKRYFELMNDPLLKLTEEEVNEGWHFCNEWDGLLIHETDPEAEFCS